MASAAPLSPSDSLELNKLLNPEVGARAAEFATDFANARPFPHVVIDSFLNAEACAALLAEFPSFASASSLNERGEAGLKAAVPDIPKLGKAYRAFDRLMQDGKFLSIIGDITGIPNLLYDSDYLGGGTHENLSGQELDTHVDFNIHPRTRWHRRLNLILFLNPSWNAEWGGCLELLPDPFATNDVRFVEPLMNRCVIFETSEHSWHGFRRIVVPPGLDTSRRSIAVYFYTKEEPVRGAAPSHGTFYYQRPLAERFRPGYTLNEDDVNEIQGLFFRRDHYIRFLYDRELEFSTALNNASTATTESLQIELAELKKRMADNEVQLNGVRDSRWVKLGNRLGVGPRL